MELDDEDPSSGPTNRACSAEQNHAGDGKQESNLENKPGNHRATAKAISEEVEA